MKPLLRIRKSARNPSCGMFGALCQVGYGPLYTLATVGSQKLVDQVLVIGDGVDHEGSA